MKHRYINDLVIITTLPHYIGLYYIFDDFYYSLILILASSSSVLWHSKEDDEYLYIIDHVLSLSLSGYEILNNKDIMSTTKDFVNAFLKTL